MAGIVQLTDLHPNVREFIVRCGVYANRYSGLGLDRAQTVTLGESERSYNDTITFEVEMPESDRYDYDESVYNYYRCTLELTYMNAEGIVETHEPCGTDFRLHNAWLLPRWGTDCIGEATGILWEEGLPLLEPVPGGGG